MHTTAAADDRPVNPIRRALDHASHLLPDQGPLASFVHHNTLHAFQHLPFHEALKEASALHGSRVYKADAFFREHLKTGRILAEHLDEELVRYLRQADIPPDEVIAADLTRASLLGLALHHDLAHKSAAELEWAITEEGFGKRFLDDLPSDIKAELSGSGVRHIGERLAREGASELARAWFSDEKDPALAFEQWLQLPATDEAIRAALADDPELIVATAMWRRSVALAKRHVRRPTKQPASKVLLHRDALFERREVDIWRAVHPVLARWAAAYLDEGIAYWPMPDRDQGFYPAVRRLMREAPIHGERWLSRAAAEFARQEQARLDAMGVIEDRLQKLGVGAPEIDDYVLHLLLALPGFGGMFSRLERRPDERAPHAPPTSLADFLAVRLTLEVAALEEAIANEPRLSLSKLRRFEPSNKDAAPEPTPLDGPHRLFMVAQLAGLGPAALDALHASDASKILGELTVFDDFTRGRIYLEAYERRYREQIVDAMAAHVAAGLGGPSPAPIAQIVCCIDDREESLRRHIEELSPRYETLGAAGSFGLAIDFHGVDDGNPTPLGPAGVIPKHEIRERPLPEAEPHHERRSRLRRLWGRLSHQTLFGTRTAVRGTLMSTLLGPAALAPMAARILHPPLASGFSAALRRFFLPEVETYLHNDEEAELGERGKVLGFTLAERIERVAVLLENMGLVSQFAPLVVLLAHGSTSLNNPHKAAYDCGACAGRRGGATARLWADMANDPRVRAGLRERGIDIPDSTWFIGGEHDTASDRIDLYDLRLVPEQHREILEQLRRDLDEARVRDAHERCRKFDRVPLGVSPAAALRHVEIRSDFLAEPRPEYGHATNAMCVVGPRALTRGLFFDRRCFVVSYEPSIDSDGKILERILGVVGPVGAGISLEYYFSAVDQDHYGCGTKLPHNVCGYLGVLNGTSGDLRTGLVQQMIEIHEPMRLLVVVTASPERLLAIAARQPAIQELVGLGWIQLVSQDIDTGRYWLFQDGGFIPYEPHAIDLPRAQTSMDYYRNTRATLIPARIEGALSTEPAE